MTAQRIGVILTLVNVVILTLIVSRAGLAVDGNAVGVLRGRALEIVDERGQVRARINIEPAVTTADGTTYPESAVLRLVDPSGRIRVKLGADQDGSGLLLANDTQQPGVHILAKSDGSTLKLIHQESRHVLTAGKAANDANAPQED